MLANAWGKAMKTKRQSRTRARLIYRQIVLELRSITRADNSSMTGLA